MSPQEPPFLPRALGPTLERAIAQFPAVVLTGPRQAGKTTLLEHLLSESHRFVTLDLPEVQDLAVRDPALFFEMNPAPPVIEEVQQAPQLLPYLKVHIDRERDRRGRFVLTGSQSFALMTGVTESLAGRAAVLDLQTLSYAERLGLGQTCRLDVRPDESEPPEAVPSMIDGLVRGGFPELVTHPDIDAELWFESYLRTYLDRDVRQLRQVGNLLDFRRLVVALAARAGQLLNLSELARDLGIAVNTVKAWVTALEASHQVQLVPPYAANLSKRLIKRPKVYFLDSGLLAHLLGVRDPGALLAGALGGHLFENAVFGEIVRHFAARGRRAPLTFFRSSDGLEVDFIVELAEGLLPVEVKLASSPRPGMASGITRLREILGDKLLPGFVVTMGGEGVFPLNRLDRALPFARFAAGDGVA